MAAYTSETWPIAAKMVWGTKTLDGAPIAEHPEEWHRQMKQIAKVGYTAFDPTDVWVPFWEFDEQKADDFIGEARDLGLTMPSLSMGRRSVVDVEHGEEYLDMAHTVVDFGRRAGSSVVNVGFMQDLTPAQAAATWFWLEDGHVDDPALRDLAIERIQKLGDYAAQYDIKIALEMYEDTYVGTGDEAVSFVTDVDRPNVGLNIDVGNLVRLHRPIEPPEVTYDKVIPYANFWHIKNYVRDEDPRTGAYFSHPAPLESGYVNYRTVIEKALRAGFDGPFMTEHYGSDWLGVGVQNLRYLREVLALALDE